MGQGEIEDAAITRAEVVSKVCDRIAGGESVNAIFSDKSAQLPDAATWWRWIAADKEIREAYDAALRSRGEKYAEEIVRIVDGAGSPLLHPETGDAILTPDGQPIFVVDRVAVEHAKARADARKWVASRLLPKRYGDRTTIAGDADNPLTVDVTDARATLLRGLAPKPPGSGTDSTS